MEKDLFQIIKSEEIVLIEFINTNCEPCAMNEPILQQVKNTLGKRVEINVVSMEEVPEFVKIYKIDTAPTIVCFQSEKLIWRTTEILSKQQIVQKVLAIV